MTDLFNMVIAACHNPRRGFAESSFRIKHQKKIIEREAKKKKYLQNQSLIKTYYERLMNLSYQSDP